MIVFLRSLVKHLLKRHLSAVYYRTRLVSLTILIPLPLINAKNTTLKMSNKRQKRSTETVKFNIGGDRFEVSRDMLQTNHPDTMLARIASEKWQEDAKDEIFIERNGKIFGYVLSHLRDDKVYLPITVSKEMLINGFFYYVVDFNEAKIYEKALSKAICVDSIKNGIETLETD